jgi:hypothetical protein
MSGPSEQAVETGALAVVAMWDDPTQDIFVMAREEVACALAAAHDPALGEDASVRLGDILDDVERHLARLVEPGTAHQWRTHYVAKHREGRL